MTKLFPLYSVLLQKAEKNTKIDFQGPKKNQFLKSSFLSLNLKPLYCLSPNCLFYYVEAKLSAFNPGCKIVRMPNCPTIAHQQYFLLLFKKWAKFDWYRYKWMAPRGRITVICCSQGLIVDTVKAIFLQDLWKIRGSHFYISVS